MELLEKELSIKCALNHELYGDLRCKVGIFHSVFSKYSLSQCYVNGGKTKSISII